MNQNMNILQKALVATVLLAACSDSNGGGSDTYASPQDLSARFVTVADLGTDWRETQRDIFTTREVENPSIDPSMWCPEAQTVAEPLVGLAGNGGADVEMENKKHAGGTEMFRLQAWSNADVEEYFSTLVDAVDACDGATWSNAGADFMMEKSTTEQIGDESVRWKTDIDVMRGKDKMSSVGYTQAVRFGNEIVIMQMGTFVSPSGALVTDEAKWATIVDKVTKFFEDSQ